MPSLPRLQLTDNSRGAVDSGAFFVRRQQQRERSTMTRLARDEALRRGDNRRNRRLHVRGAAAEQAAVAFGWRERIARPAIDRARRNHVHVAGEADDRGATAMPRPEILHGRAIDPLAGEAGLRQRAPQSDRAHPPSSGVRDRQAMSCFASSSVSAAAVSDP